MSAVRRPFRRNRGRFLLPVLAFVTLVLAGLLGSVIPIPQTAVGETLDPRETQTARQAIESTAQPLESTRGDIDRILRDADIQQLIGPAIVCDDTVAPECARQLAALQSAFAAYTRLLGDLPGAEAALRSYDTALMSQTRALGGAGEPLREVTWPLVGAASQLGLLETKYSAFYHPGRVQTVQTQLDQCAGLPVGAVLPPACRIAAAESLKIGQAVEARAAVGDSYRRALDRYQRALDERVAVIDSAARPRTISLLINGATVVFVAAAGLLLTLRRFPRQRTDPLHA